MESIAERSMLSVEVLAKYNMISTNNDQGYHLLVFIFILTYSERLLLNRGFIKPSIHLSLASFLKIYI
jgi:hypothetical protein